MTPILPQRIVKILKYRTSAFLSKRAFPFTLCWRRNALACARVCVWKWFNYIRQRQCESLKECGHSSIIIDCGCDGHPSPDLTPSDQTREEKQVNDRTNCIHEKCEDLIVHDSLIHIPQNKQPNRNVLTANVSQLCDSRRSSPTPQCTQG